MTKSLGVLLNSTHILHTNVYPVCIIITNNALKVSTRYNTLTLLDGLVGPGVGNWDPARYNHPAGYFVMTSAMRDLQRQGRGSCCRKTTSVVQPTHHICTSLYATKVSAAMV